jgi:hypothetical protein
MSNNVDQSKTPVAQNSVKAKTVNSAPREDEKMQVQDPGDEMKFGYLIRNYIRPGALTDVIFGRFDSNSDKIIMLFLFIVLIQSR